MLVSGGKILAIDEVLTDWTVSGDGVKEPLGLDRGLYEEIQKVSGDQAKIEALKAHSGAWDSAYSAINQNSGKWNIVGNEGIEAVYDENQKTWIIGTSGEIELAFESSGHSLEITSKEEGALKTYNFEVSKENVDHWNAVDPLSEHSGAWDNTYSAVDQYSAYWNKASDEVAENSARWNAYSGFIDECMKTSALHSGAYQSAIQDEDGSQLKDADGDGITDNTDSYFWSAYSGLPFFAQRASADAFGNLFQDEYATKDELNDFYTKEEADARFFPINGLDETSGRWETTSDTVDSQSAKWEKLYDTSSTWNGVEALSAHSGAWDSTYSAVRDTSAAWNKTHEEVEASAYLWNSAYSETSAFKEVDSDLWQTASETVADQSAYWNEASDIVADNSGKWNGVAALSDHSGAWDSTYSAVSTYSGDWNADHDILKENSAVWMPITSLDSAAYGSPLTDEMDGNLYDSNNNGIVDDSETPYWTGYSGIKFAAERASADLNGVPFSAYREEIGNLQDEKLDKDDFESWSAQSFRREELSAYSGYVDETYAKNSADIWNDTYGVVKENSGFWAESAEFFVVEDQQNLFNISSKHDTAGWHYQFSAALQDPYGIEGNNGVSAQLNAGENRYEVGLEKPFYDNINKTSAAVDTSAKFWNEAYGLSSSADGWNKTSGMVADSAYRWNSAYSVVSGYDYYDVDPDLWNGVSALSAHSAAWDNAYSSVDTSAKFWNSAYSEVSAFNTVDPDFWDEASQTVASNSAKWNELYGASASWNNKMERSELSAYSAEIDTWYAKKSELPEAPGIEGYSGVSATYDEATNKYLVALSGQKELVFTSSGETIDLSSSGVGHFNIEVARSDVEFINLSTTNDVSIGTSKTELTGLTSGTHSEGFDLNGLAEHGLYHVDVNLKITRDSEALIPAIETINYTDGHRNLQIGGLDASTTAVRYVNLSYDLYISGNDQTFAPAFQVATGGTSGWKVGVVGIDIHRIFDHDLVGEIEEVAGSIYKSGKGIEIDDGLNINAVPGRGLTLDQNNESFEVDPSSGLNFNANDGLYVDLSSGLKYTPDGALMLNTGSGLKFNTNGSLEVYLGPGLKFETSGSIAAITIDNQVEEVVEAVEELTETIDTMVTTNMAYANITDRYDMSNDGSSTGGGVLLGFAFSVPLANKLYLDGDQDSQFVTKLGVYAAQNYTQNYIIIGLYEFDFNNHEGYGKTVPLCDTGRVKLSEGYNEFPIKHKNTNSNGIQETELSLKPGCVYYAAIYISKECGNGIQLAGCPGYSNAFNQAEPQMSLDQCNIGIHLSNAEQNTGTHAAGVELDDISFNLMGWGSWNGDQGNFHECPAAHRFFLTVRNVKKPVSP